MRQLLTKPLARYLIVGSAAFLMEYGSFYIMFSGLKWSLYLANSLSFGFGLLTSFCFNRLWTFGQKDKAYSKRAAHQMSFYILLALVNLLLTNLLIGWFRHLGIVPQIGKLLAMGITSLWNYFLFKILIFTHQPDAKQPQAP